ncbi:MAG: glycoside hydrolase family 25 protein [Beijerinckiaceae bacterium]
MKKSLKTSLGLCGAALAAVLLLVGCATEDHSWRYSQKSDAKPHPGVASASRYPIHGIDISRWQSNIDWRTVRAAGTRFAFIKATEGGDHIDPRFRENWAGARAAGVPVGAYHFVYWCRPAHEQAQWFIQHIPSTRDNLTLPPVLDVEWNGHSRTCPRKVSRQVAIEKMRLMLRELEQHTGRRPIIYTDISFHKDVLEGVREFDGYPFWIRSTAARPEERYQDRRWEFWQYTTTGRIPGINGNVDRNAFYGSEQEFQAWLAGQYDIALRTPASRFAAAPAPVPAPVAPQQAPAPTAVIQTSERPSPVEEPLQDNENEPPELRR